MQVYLNFLKSFLISYLQKQGTNGLSAFTSCILCTIISKKAINTENLWVIWGGVQSMFNGISLMFSSNPYKNLK